LRPFRLLAFMLLGSCCCWDPFCSWCFTGVGDSSVVGISFVAGIPALADVPADFRIYAVVCVSAVVLVLLLYPFRKNRKTYGSYIMFYFSHYLFTSLFPFVSFISFCFASDFECFSSMRNKREKKTKRYSLPFRPFRFGTENEWCPQH